MSRDEELCLIFQKVAHQQTKVDDIVDIIVKLDPCEADVAPLSHSLSHMHTVHKHPGQQLSNSRLRQSHPTVSDSVRQCPTVATHHHSQNLSDSSDITPTVSDRRPTVSDIRQSDITPTVSDICPTVSDSVRQSDSQGSRFAGEE